LRDYASIKWEEILKKADFWHFFLKINVSERNERMKVEYVSTFSESDSSSVASHWSSPALIFCLLHAAPATFRLLWFITYRNQHLQMLSEGLTSTCTALHGSPAYAVPARK